MPNSDSPPVIAPPILTILAWQTKILLEVIVDVPPQDAATPAEATAFALDLFAALELRVSLGGVPLKASLSGL